MPATRPLEQLRLLLLTLAALALAALAQAATASAQTNDPLYQYQWGPQQVRAPEAWALSRGSGAVIAIVDTGIDLDHPDLQANVLAGNTFLDCGDRGCGNGDWQSGPKGERDGHPHGTHVAGIAASVTGNGEGIAGVAPEAKLLAVRVLDDEGSGSFEDVARGIRYATDQGADVINLSLGAIPGAQLFVITGFITDVEEAIEYANSKGVVVVAASGNEAFPLCDEPAFDPGAVCVTATDKRELRSWYSNHPLKRDFDTVAAPGGSGIFVKCYEGILSTVPTGEGGSYCRYPQSKAYDEYDGTSMAAPHAAGVAGLMSAQGCTRDHILSLFRTTSRQPVTGARGTWTPAYGWGIVDAQAATAAATAVCATSGSTAGGGSSGTAGEDGGSATKKKDRKSRDRKAKRGRR